MNRIAQWQEFYNKVRLHSSKQNMTLEKYRQHIKTMPIINVDIQPGYKVKEGQILIIEAMNQYADSFSCDAD